MKIHIFPYHLLLFIFGFIVFTVIGTISHEYGHIAVAEALGHKTKLHYGSMNWKFNQKQELDSIYRKNLEYIKIKEKFKGEKHFVHLIEKLQSHSLLISMGGPLQTILTGIVGLVILLFRRKHIHECGMKFLDWLAVFLSLFWLREIFNLALSLADGIFKNENYFGGDEAKISLRLGLPIGIIPIALGIIGLIICLFVIFRIIPLQKRFTFILGGLIGGIAGFILWMELFGPILLP